MFFEKLDLLISKDVPFMTTEEFGYLCQIIGTFNLQNDDEDFLAENIIMQGEAFAL